MGLEAESADYSAACSLSIWEQAWHRASQMPVAAVAEPETAGFGLVVGQVQRLNLQGRSAVWSCGILPGIRTGLESQSMNTYLESGTLGACLVLGFPVVGPVLWVWGEI